MNIDTIYEDVIRRLTENNRIMTVSRELLACKSNGERVLYVYDVLESLNALPLILCVPKTDNVSKMYRNYGNQCYQNKNDYKAWQYYNLSLLHAPINSECYCVALSNRSAVFYSLKKYEECLQDTKEVFSLDCPEKLKDKLAKRQASCEEYLANKKIVNDENCDDIEKILTMRGPTESRYPCASSKLEVVFNQEMGRHVIAKEDIKVGEILAQEDPYFTLLLKSQYLFSCSYCLSRSCNLLPCENCCFSLYCSTECRKNAWNDYHSVECCLMPSLVSMEFTKLELLAFRTVIKARKDHSSWNSLFKTIDEAESNMNTEFRGHVKVNGQWVYDSKYYASIHTLASNIEKRSMSDIFQKSTTAAIFLYYLKSKTDFLRELELVKSEGDIDETSLEKICECAGGMILLHIMTSATNMHGLSTNIENADGNFIDEISLASAPYAYHSLLNHSCVPNVVRFEKLGTAQMILYALRPIKKGMQLYDNYGSHHALEERSERQKSLKFQYKFTCTCEACINDWPTYLNLASTKPVKNLPSYLKKQKEDLLTPEAIEKLQKGDKGTALKLFKPLCELLDALDKYAPCLELSDCQESLKQCLSIFCGVVPYGYSNLVKWSAFPPNII